MTILMYTVVCMAAFFYFTGLHFIEGQLAGRGFG